MEEVNFMQMSASKWVQGTFGEGGQIFSLTGSISEIYMPQLLIPQGVYYILGYYTAYNLNTCNNDDEPVCHLIKVPLFTFACLMWKHKTRQDKVSKVI